ncbi:MAG: hypothetical protein H3C50_07855 [Kiritimatiellae bacterium]|nr:hypothetical protein [Kiritimatiellia bacterium]MCO5067171.1 hypothetical protein [Kiritimatiellia bacterium]
MRNRSSISSSRWLRSGLLLSVLAVLAIEWQLGRTLPGHYFRHEVDDLLYSLDHRSYDARVLSLGNSVGRQLDQGIHRLDRGFLRPMSSNAALEMTGQYFLLCRYLARNPAPESLILWVDNPFYGDLRSVYTENYIQRCFLRWREIGLLAWWRGSPTFTASMISYRLLPSFRYRMDIQKDIPILGVHEVNLAPQVAFGGRPQSARKQNALARWWQQWVHGGQSISTTAFERLLALCEERGIRIYLIPAPISSRVALDRGPQQGRAEINERLAELQKKFDVLHYETESKVYPDNEFVDGTHFVEGVVLARAAEYRDLLQERMKP